MIKKIAGVLFIIIAVMLFLGVVAQIPDVLSTIANNDVAYSSGYVVGTLLFFVAGYFLLRLGIKWTKI